MYELKKTLWMVLLSTPVLIGINDLADSVASYPDQAALYLSSEPVSTQAYDKGTDPLY